MKFQLFVLNFLLLQFCVFNLVISQEKYIATDTSIINSVNCNEVLLFASAVLDSSQFSNEGVIERNSAYINAKENLNCAAYPLLLTIAGLQKFISNDLLSSRHSLLTADSIYKSRNEIKSKYYIRNNIFLGFNYNKSNDLVKSIMYLNLAKKLSIETNNYRLLGDALYNLGVIYLEQNNISEAKLYFEEAIVHSEKVNNFEIIAFCNLNYCRLLRLEKKYDEALARLKIAESLFEEKNMVGHLYGLKVTKAEVLQEMGNPSMAIKELTEALSQGDETEHKYLHGLIFYYLAELYEEQNFIKSIEFYELAFANANSLEDDQYNNAKNALTAHFLKTKDVDKFYEMVEELSKFNMLKRDLMKIEILQSDKREISIQKEKAENAVLRLENRMVTAKYQIIFVGLLSLILFALYEYNELKKKKLLIDEIAVKNEKLNYQNIELKNFAAMASHDLKSPASSISKFAGLIKSKISKDDSKILDYLNIIETSAKDMSRLVTSLLKYSSLENKKLTFSSFSLRTLFEQVFNNLFSISENRNVKINMADNLPDQIVGAEIELKTTIQNIIHNAIKFVPEERDPVIDILYREEAGYHMISICDNGIGMEQDNLDKVFLMFHKVHSASEYSGSGIGLSTCKKIIDLHNGKIEVESKLNEGSIFKLYIPQEL